MDRCRKRPDPEANVSSSDLKRPCPDAAGSSVAGGDSDMDVADADADADADPGPSSSPSDGDGDTSVSSGSPERPGRDRFSTLIAAVSSADSSESAKLAALTELCEALAFWAEDAAGYFPTELAAPALVRLAEDDVGADMMLLAVRAMTYLCDSSSSAMDAVVRHGVVPVLCSRLLAIEYLDVAEQCLQALEKISQHFPSSCLQAGMIVAVLTYIDFFSSSIQRVAVAAIANVCKKVPLDYSSTVMESVPTLCNMLMYEDNKLVDTVATCLVRIVESFCSSPELLNELCSQGVIVKSLQLINTDRRMSLCQTTNTSLFGLLTKLAKSSLVAVKSLFELNISCTVREILVPSDLSHGMTYSAMENLHHKQVNEILMLVNQLVPASADNVEDVQTVLAKEKFLSDHPLLFAQFSKDVLPLLIKAVHSGANTHLCYCCATVVNNIVYASKPEMLLELLREINISSFLASLLSRKNQHILFLSLRIVEMLMQKLPDVFLRSFIKEGVVHAVEAILVQEKYLEGSSDLSDGVHQPDGEATTEGTSRCFCYAFDSCEAGKSESKICKLGNKSVFSFARHVKTSYFTHEALSSNTGLMEILLKLKNCCGVLDEAMGTLSKNDSSLSDEYMNNILGEVMMEFYGGDSMSTFEFLESGLVRSLANYLSDGNYIQGTQQDQNTEHFITVLKRIQKFTHWAFSTTEQSGENMLMTHLVRKLQNALTSLDSFPVVTSHAHKPNNISPDIPSSRTIVLPCIQVSFRREENELNLDKYEKILNVDISQTLDAIEDYLFPKVKNANEDKKDELSENVITTDGTVGQIISVETDSIESSAASSEDPKNQEVNSSSAMDPSKQETMHYERGAGETKNNRDVASKIVFSIKGKKLDSSATLYNSILQDQMSAGQDMLLGSKFWNDVHEVTYRSANNAVSDDYLPTCLAQRSQYGHQSAIPWHTFPFYSCLLQARLPCNLDRSSSSYDILFLLKVLEGINRFSFQVSSDEKCQAFVQDRIDDLDDLKIVTSSIPQEEFISLKLTEKLEQQMRDPLVLNSSIIPTWFVELLTGCPFLFSFDVRCKYFRLATFGPNVQNDPTQPPGSREEPDRNGNPSNPRSRLKKKFLVNRNDVLGSAAKMMASHAQSKDPLEVEYFEEVGFGLGPTMEFYTLISHEFQKGGLEMWRGETRSDLNSRSDCDQKFVEAPLGLFPRPWSSSSTCLNDSVFLDVQKHFSLLGQVVAKALKDGRMLDIHFSKAFYKLILEQELTIYDILSFDPELGKILLEFQALVDKNRFSKSVSREHCMVTSDILYRQSKIEDLGIDFTLPGYAEHALSPDGNLKMVNAENLGEYVALVVDATIRSGISKQMKSFKSGFNEVFPLEALHIFSEDELERLICGDRDTWDLTGLIDHIRFDHGYTSSSPPVINLIKIIQEFGHDQRRAFLQFVTGSPRLPPGGLASLNPKLTVVRKHSSNGADADLPSVMTCANYLKLPAYSSKEKMKERLIYAITEGQGSFHLS